jgi:hypothetical protein
MNSVEIMTAKEARELLNNNGIEFLKKYSKSINQAIKRYASLGYRSMELRFFENIPNSVLNNLKEIGYECYITTRYNEIRKQDIYVLHMDW